MSPSYLPSLPQGPRLSDFKGLLRRRHSSVVNIPISKSDINTPPEGYASPQSRQSISNEADIEAQRRDPSIPTRDSGEDALKPSRLARLPTWVSFWLGYREVVPPPEKPYVVWFWSFIGAFACVSIIENLFGRANVFVERGVPSIGGTAVLLYGAIESPVSQPRPVLGGHCVGALTGIVVTKLFLLLPTEERFDELNWLAASLCCALSLVLMQMTGTMHPPAGATALLAAVSPEIRAIGWFYLPVVILAASVAVVVALFCNNMQRRYPTYWWTPPPTTARSFFAVLPLGKTLENTWAWTSNRSRKLIEFRSYSTRKRGKKHGSSMHSTLGPHYSKIFSSGRNSRSGSRDSSKTSRPSYSHYDRGNDIHHVDSPLASIYASPHASRPGTPMPSSLPASPPPSTEDLHVAFQVEPLHHHHQGHNSRTQYPGYHHPHHYSHQNTQFLGMKVGGTWSPAADRATPAESIVVSRNGDPDLHRGRRGQRSSEASSTRNASRKAHPDPQHEPEEHARQLMKAVTCAIMEREAQEKNDGEEGRKDGEEREVDLSECLEMVVRSHDPPSEPTVCATIPDSLSLCTYR